MPTTPNIAPLQPADGNGRKNLAKGWAHAASRQAIGRQKSYIFSTELAEFPTTFVAAKTLNLTTIRVPQNWCVNFSFENCPLQRTLYMGPNSARTGNFMSARTSVSFECPWQYRCNRWHYINCAPTAMSRGTTRLNSRRISDVRGTSTAFRFCSIWIAFRVPGMGTTF